MTYLAVALAVALLAAIGYLTRLIQQQQHAHARREDLLLNQLLHLAGRPWQQAPADQPKASQPAPRGFDTGRYTTSPEAGIPIGMLSELPHPDAVDLSLILQGTDGSES